MDDPYEDWEIDDQNTCEYLEGGGGGECNVRWVLEKGMDLGKKAVITGFVVSSAPVVLPSILVVSAVGFACSVPFGLVFTGYACTQKLMSTLLPMPTASHILEYDKMYDDEAEVKGRGEGKYRFESHVYMEEEKEQRDYVRAGVEESIELVKNENEVAWEDHDSKDMRRDNQLFADKTEEVEGRGEGNDRIERRVCIPEDVEKEKMDDQRAGVEESVDSVKNENEVPRKDDDSKHSRRDDQIFGDEDEKVEGRRERKDRIEGRFYMEEKGKEQIGVLGEGLEESTELVNNEYESPQEEDEFKDIKRDDELIVTSENISLEEEGYEEDDDEPLEYNNESSGRPDKGTEDAIEQERKSEELMPQEDTLEPSKWTDSREEERGKMDGIRASAEDSTNENEVPEEEDPKDTPRDDELRMTTENNSMKESHEEDDIPIVYNNEGSEEKVAREDKGHEEAVNQERKPEEVRLEEDAPKPSDWITSREEEKEKTGGQTSAVDGITLLKNENEAPDEEDYSKNTRRDSEPRMTNEAISLDESHEEDHAPIVYNNEGSKEIVGQAHVGQEEDIIQERKSEELMLGEDALKPSEWIESTEEEKEQMDDLRERVEESIELVKDENDVPLEDDDSKDTQRDDEPRMTSENISPNEGHEEDAIPAVFNNGSSDEMVAREDVGREESINQKSKCERLFPKEDALKLSDWTDSREDGKEKIDDLSDGVTESIESVKNENEVQREEENPKDSRREDEPRMTSKNLTPNEDNKEGDIPIVYNNDSSEEMVAREDMGQEESINEESKCKELFPKEDAIKPSDWTNSREEEKEKMDAKDENEVPREDGDESRMTTENISLKEGHAEDDEPNVYNNKSSMEMVDREDMEQKECIGQERKSIELFPKEDARWNSDWTYSREVKGEWVVTEVKIEGEEEIRSEESINENIVGPTVLRKFSECQTKVNNDEEEDIKRGSVGLLEKIRDEGKSDDATEETKNKNKKKKTSEESAEMSLPEVNNRDVISENLTVANGVTKNRQTGPEKRQKLEDRDEVGMQQLPVGGAASSDDLIPSQENIRTLYPFRESDKTNGIGDADPVVIENVDVTKISGTVGKPNAAYAENSEVHSVLTTEKEVVDEEKIWEQIDALRKIVGYKATTYRSSIEEVKALYTFTGIELPSSFGNPPDLAEVSNKLRFLMSILGVK